MAKPSKEINGYKVIRDIDITLVSLCSHGLTAKKISEDLLKIQKVTMSYRTVQGRIETLKKIFKCDSLPHLVGTFFRQKLID